jgi:hypothetical protein
VTVKDTAVEKRLADVASGAGGTDALQQSLAGVGVTLDDYRALEIHGGKGAGLRTALQDKGHRAELEAFHRFATGQAEAPMRLEEMVEVTELSFAIRDQARGAERRSAQ